MIDLTDVVQHVKDRLRESFHRQYGDAWEKEGDLEDALERLPYQIVKLVSGKAHLPVPLERHESNRPGIYVVGRTDGLALTEMSQEERDAAEAFLREVLESDSSPANWKLEGF